MKKKITIIYKTKDGEIFDGKNALLEAKMHQRNLDFMETAEDFFPEVQKIFGIKGKYKDLRISKNPSCSKVVTALEDAVFDIGTFEKLINSLTFLYLEIPELLNFFKFIKKRVENSQ